MNPSELHQKLVGLPFSPRIRQQVFVARKFKGLPLKMLNEETGYYTYELGIIERIGKRLISGSGIENNNSRFSVSARDYMNHNGSVRVFPAWTVMKRHYKSINRNLLRMLGDYAESVNREKQTRTSAALAANAAQIELVANGLQKIDTPFGVSIYYIHLNCGADIRKSVFFGLDGPYRFTNEEPYYHARCFTASNEHWAKFYSGGGSVKGANLKVIAEEIAISQWEGNESK